MRLLRWAISRLASASGLILAVITCSFLLIHLAPGDPVGALVSQYGGASPDVIAALRRQFGLDRPLFVQYGLYMWNVVHGNLGQSFQFQLPVSQVIGERLPATLLLLGTSIIVFTLLGVVVGVYSAVHADSAVDNATRFFVVLAYAVPVFWLAQLLIYMLAVKWPLFPVMGNQSFFVAPGLLPRAFDGLWHLVLPVTALGMWNLAVTQRFMRTSMAQALHQDYVRTAFAKGLSRSRVFYRHALRNALVPVVTMTGLSFATLMAGAALTETVFGWPGVGRLMFQAITGRDRPLLLGLLLVGSAVTIIADSLADFTYGLLDPRTRAHG
jgi:peptide/nickel transport system permease protein